MFLQQSHAIVVHSADSELDSNKLGIGQIGAPQWQDLGKEQWSHIVATASGRPFNRIRKDPRPHQKEAVGAAKAHFRSNTRGRLNMPCGTGKSLTGILIAEDLGAQAIVVAAPSLSLIRQNLRGWSEEFDAKGATFDCICVCSDESVAKAAELDDVLESASSFGIEVTTDLNEIVRRLKRERNRPLVVFTTYHSSPLLAEATRIAGVTFDVGILDEAHKTVGASDRAFATLLDDGRISIRKRVAMTATERVYRGERKDVLSMDNEADYGSCFYKMSFKDAIERGLICDYKIVTFFVGEAEIRKLIETKASVRLDHENHGTIADGNALSLAAGIALKNVINDYGVKHAISFHRSIAAAENFTKQQVDLDQLLKIGPAVRNLHISSRISAGDRSRIMDEFAETEIGVVSNARCLTEGVDVPNTDCILFADPKQSAIDIVQAAGRAMRVHAGKKFGYIVIPVVVPEDMTFDEFAVTTEFRKIALTLTALSVQDDRLALEFRNIATGQWKRKKQDILIHGGMVPKGVGMDFSQFAAAVQTRIWSATMGRLNYRPFDEARLFVHSLNLKGVREWKEFAKSSRKPPDIPNAVDRIYVSEGWKDWGDFLGTGTVADKKKIWRPFEEARAFVRELGLSSTTWLDFVKTDAKPSDIPSRPDVAYADSGFISYGDWVGGRAPSWRPFEEAREYVRTLGLKDTTEWNEFVKSNRLPSDIPRTPSSIYANSGWNGLSDWLGATSWRPFEEARAFVRTLGLKDTAEWKEFLKSNQLPGDIPRTPSSVYANSGWNGLADWLGSGPHSAKLQEMNSEEEESPAFRL